MQEIYLPKLIAWLATVLCVIASARGATVFAKNNSRVFTILALFSLNWALLIPYYSELSQSELIAGFAGFLLVYIGILLRREARESATTTQEIIQSPPDSLSPNDTKNGDIVRREDRIALWILRLLIAPSLISLPFPTNTNGFLSRSITEPIIGSFVTLLGYYSVWSAIKIYSSNKRGKLIMTGIIIFYAVIEVAFLVYALTGHIQSCPPNPAFDFWRNPCTNMPAPFLIFFAVLKMLFSGTLIYLVLEESLSPEDRRLPTIEKIFKFAGI